MRPRPPHLHFNEGLLFASIMLFEISISKPLIPKLSRLGLGYLTAPIVKPCTSCFCANHPAMTTGKTDAVAPADIFAQNNPSAVLNDEM